LECTKKVGNRFDKRRGADRGQDCALCCEKKRKNRNTRCREVVQKRQRNFLGKKTAGTGEDEKPCTETRANGAHASVKQAISASQEKRGKEKRTHSCAETGARRENCRKRGGTNWVEKKQEFRGVRGGTQKLKDEKNGKKKKKRSRDDGKKGIWG